MINLTLKRMFLDPDCTEDEAKMLAAIQGKTYDECRIEFQTEFKRDFFRSHQLYSFGPLGWQA